MRRNTKYHTNKNLKQGRVYKDDNDYDSETGKLKSNKYIDKLPKNRTKVNPQYKHVRYPFRSICGFCSKRYCYEYMPKKDTCKFPLTTKNITIIFDDI